MSSLYIIGLLAAIFGLVLFLIWDNYRRAKHPSQPPVTAESLAQIMEGILQKYVSQTLGDGSTFFVEKLEKDYQQTLQGALTEVQKDEERRSSEAGKQFGQWEQSFREHLDALELSAKKQTDLLAQKITTAEAEYEKFLQNLNSTSQQTQFQSIEGAKVKVDKLFEDFEIKLADFLLQSEQKMMLAVDLELRSARQLIDTYKVQQMNVIDENIMAMLEKTLSLVLAKNLDLKDQMDFVYQSLEKAKAEMFVV